MGLIVRVLFPLVAYLSVATMITVGAGYGYLRRTGRLDDDTLFRIVSLLHGVDLDAIAQTHDTGQQDTPPEEISLKQHNEQMQIAALHLQAKQTDLERQRSEFDYEFRQLNTAMSRYQEFRDEVEKYLEERKQEAIESGLVSVRSQLQNLDPKKQAKPILKQMIEEGRTDAVILLLNGMTAKKRTDILKTFNTEEDIKQLHLIQQQMLTGEPEKTFIDERISALNQLRAQENK